MSEPRSGEDARDRVSRYYAGAVTRPCRGETGLPKGALAGCAGYTEGELAALPGDAIENSFGCGNPLAGCDVRGGHVVLDLGCGAGIDLILASRRVGPSGRVIGVDMTDAMIERAVANVAAAGCANVQIRKGIIENLPVATAAVDWVISNCVITLSREKDRVFSEIHRVLRPAGQMVVSDLVADNLGPVVHDVPWIGRTCLATAMSEREYMGALAAAGLANVSVVQRTEYGETEAAALLRSEVPEGIDVGDPDIAAAARRCAGKVWSLRIRAAKPARRRHC